MRWAPALAAVLLLAPLPALADVTARYAAGPVELTIEADDGGDWRFHVPGECTLIRRGGVDYIVLGRPDPVVYKLDDFIAAADTAERLSAAPQGFARAKFILARGADAEVAGRKGVTWRFGPEAADLGRPLAIVTSKDPALAPIGGVFVMLQQRLTRLLLGALPSESNLPQMIAALVETGTPLRVDTLFELRSVDTQTIDPKVFDLPGPVADIAMPPAKTAPGKPRP